MFIVDSEWISNCDTFRKPTVIGQWSFKWSDVELYIIINCNSCLLNASKKFHRMLLNLVVNKINSDFVCEITWSGAFALILFEPICKFRWIGWQNYRLILVVHFFVDISFVRTEVISFSAPQWRVCVFMLSFIASAKRIFFNFLEHIFYDVYFPWIFFLHHPLGSRHILLFEIYPHFYWYSWHRARTKENQWLKEPCFTCSFAAIAPSAWDPFRFFLNTFILISINRSDVYWNSK